MTSLPPPSPAGSASVETALSPLPLTPWLTVLVALTTLATLRTLLLPPWPRADPLPSPTVIQAALQRSGLRPSLLLGEPALRNAEQALSPSLVFRLEDGQILRLRHGAVRRYQDFMLASITRNVPDLALKDRTLVPAGQGVADAIGTVKGGRSRQSCLVPGSMATQPFGVTHEQLTVLVMGRPNPPQRLLAGLVGLRPMRTYDCVVVSLQAPSGAEPSAATWQRVVAALTPYLSRARQESPNL